MNRLLRRAGALTVAAEFPPAWGYTMSLWNPSDKGSRRFAKKTGRREAHPRRTRLRKRTQNTWISDASFHRNQTFHVDFDSTLGYPGEGPKIATAGGPNRSRVRVLPGIRKGLKPRILGRRTSTERRQARKGIKLRDGVLQSVTRKLHGEAFVRLWSWAKRLPPDEIKSVSCYFIPAVTMQ